MACIKYNRGFKQKIIDDCNARTTQSELYKKYKMSKVDFLINIKPKELLKLSIQVEGRRKVLMLIINIEYVKKNPFASARDTIWKFELDISENTER